MKRSALMIGPLILAVGAFWVAGCGNGSTSKVEDGGAVQIAQKLCPVMGGPIDKDIYVDHDGRRVYFCCKMCVAKFKEDPDTYIKKLDEQAPAAKVWTCSMHPQVQQAGPGQCPKCGMELVPSDAETDSHEGHEHH